MYAGAALLHLEILRGLGLYFALSLTLAPAALPGNIRRDGFIAGVRASPEDLLVCLDQPTTNAAV